jgi:hypothetical protein
LLRFGEAAIKLGLITEADLQQALSHQFAYPHLSPGEGHFSPDLIAAYEPFGEQAEQLRALRSQLMMRWFANGHKTLTIAASMRAMARLSGPQSGDVFQLGERTVDRRGSAPAPPACVVQFRRLSLSSCWRGVSI